MISTDKIVISAGVTLGSALVALGGVAVHKLHRLSKKFDRSVSELEDVTIKDIQKEMVRSAVENAAKATVDDYMKDVNRAVLADARAELRREANAAVSEAEKDIRERVTEELSEAASKIDIAEMKREVRAKAEAKVLSRFDDNLSDVVGKYSKSLGGIAEAYSTIANDIRKAVTKDEDRKVTLNLG